MKSLRIGIDAHLLSYRRGIGNCVYNLLTALAELPAPHRYILYVNDPKACANAPDDPRFTVRLLTPGFIPIWEQVALPRAAAQDRCDLLHCMANTGPLSMPPNMPLMLTIHDVMYLLPRRELPASPSLYQRLGRLYYKQVTTRVSHRARAIMTVSHFSRADIIRRLRLPEAKVRVILNAPNADCRRLPEPEAAFPVLQRLGVKQPYILALGAVDPRKNTARVIEAFAQIHKSGAYPHQLVICGLSPARQAPFRRRAEALGVSEAVLMTGFVTEEELVAFYNAADLLAYPTLYEGFGLPVLEAMVCGTPVLTSAVAAIPEIAGEAALYADPLDVESIRQGMETLLADSALRERLIQRGFAQAAPFNWRRSAQELLRLYEETANAR